MRHAGEVHQSKKLSIRQNARQALATYLVLDDVHHQLDRSEIGGEREAIRHELE